MCDEKFTSYTTKGHPYHKVRTEVGEQEWES